MDSKEDLSRNSDDGGPGQKDCTENRKRREAKGICLKIEGHDGYVFKSYSITPQAMDAKPAFGLGKNQTKALPTVSSSPLGWSPRVGKQRVELLAEGQQKSPALLTASDESQNTKSSSEVIKTKTEKLEKERIEPTATDEGNQGDENLAFDNSMEDFSGRDSDDCYNLLSDTLYDVAMDAVTQSLLSSMRSSVNPRKKSPAWNHFFISPRDGTKAICMYCMKEFSRGKNEKDLSTSCLMRHVRRAHPTVLLQDGEFSSASLPCSVSSSSVPPANSPNNGKLAANASGSQESTSTSASADSTELVSKEVTLKSDKNAKMDNGTTSSPNSGNDHNEDELDVSEHALATPKNPNSRRRSAVWKHFYLSPADSSKAVCIHCMNEFSRGKDGKDLGTSCLIRHMWRAHRDIVIEENGQGSNIPTPYTTPPTLVSRVDLQDLGEVKREPQNHSRNLDVKEDSTDTPYQSGQESSLQMSLGLKSDKDFPPSSSPEDNSEGPSLKQDRSSIFQQNKKIMKRVKSEVWHHFIVSPVDHLKALCRYCPCVISRGKRGDFGTSCLMRHLMRRHPDVLQSQKSPDDTVPSPRSPHPSLAATEAPSSTEADNPARQKPRLPVFSKKTSKLWNHFSISTVDPTKVVCLHCSRTISRGKKTTNLGTSCLFRHMQRFHGHVLENKSVSGVSSSAQAQVKQELMDSSPYEENVEKFDECHPVATKITKLVSEMLALDLQPSALVENVGLNRLLEYLQPQYSLPSSSFFSSTAIPEMYERVKEVVVAHLQEAESGIVHFTTSIWVGGQTREYLTLTAHWVSYESHIRPQGQDSHCSALLSVSRVDCDRSEPSVQRQLEDLWDTWITSSGLKMGFTVTDNPGLQSPLDDGKPATVQCFRHTVDLVVGEALKSQRMVQNLLSIARKICERVHRSAKAKEKLAELQKIYHLPVNQLVQDIPSKWKTTFYMLERLVEQKKAIDEMSIECNFRELISSDQWEVMKSVCNALKPFEVACREMSNRTATLGQVIPLIHILNRKIDMLFDETMGIDNMLKSLKEAMASRLSSALHDPRYTWATMLDPRYKTSLFTEEEAERCRLDLVRELEASSSSSTSAETKPLLSNGCGEMPAPSNSTLTNDNLWALMDDIRNKIKQEERPKSSELAVLEYLEEEILDQSCDPLDYWNLKKFLWPDLAKVAVRYVGCPPSIVPAETLFSTASMNCAINQSSSLLDNLEELLFLKVNLPLIYFQY